MHVKVVNSQDTDTCLLAINRFSARRGKPATINSDNETNFQRAERVHQFSEERSSYPEIGSEATCVEV